MTNTVTFIAAIVGALIGAAIAAWHNHLRRQDERLDRESDKRIELLEAKIQCTDEEMRTWTVLGETMRQPDKIIRAGIATAFARIELEDKKKRDPNDPN